MSHYQIAIINSTEKKISPQSKVIMVGNGGVNKNGMQTEASKFEDTLDRGWIILIGKMNQKKTLLSNLKGHE